MSKVCITGHKGFIGSHLYRELVKTHEVIGIDLKEGNDIRDITAEDLKGVEYIFHLAAQPKVPLSIEKPIFTNDHNVNGTLNLLWEAKKAGVKKFIFSSSSSVYGIQDKLPLNEEMTPSPLSPYGIQKLTGEHYCRNFANLYGLKTVCLRYFNVYGEDMPADNAYSACLAIFMKQKKENKPLTIFGGRQTRDFTYVKDVVRANILAMESDIGNGETINIGGGRNHSIQEIARTISPNMVWLPQRKGEPMDTLADISKAKHLLNWSPTMDLLLWLKK